MILARYLGKLFLIRLVFLILGFLGILLIFESIMSRSSFHIEKVLPKIPLIFHQVFPFLVILSVLLFLWRLMRFHELEVLHAAGLSLWFILRVPFLIVIFVSLCDLMIIVPWGQKMLDPFKEKQGKVSLDSGGWQVHITDQEYSLARLDGKRAHFLTFSLDSLFKFHIAAEQAVHQGPYVLFERAWKITPYRAPQFRTSWKEKVQESSKPYTQHPGLMSFTETAQALENSNIPRAALRSRQDYLLSHTFWILSLVPLGTSFIVGRTGKYRKIFHIVLGLMLCALLYLIKEWVYKMTLPLSFKWQPLSLWAVPLGTFLVAFLILFEKKEL